LNSRAAFLDKCAAAFVFSKTIIFHNGGMHVEKTVLSNGLTVITDHNEKAVSTLLCYWVRAGGHHELGYPNGIAHYLEHMMFQGTTTRTKERLNELVEECGGRRNGSTYTDRTRYYMFTPFDEWRQGADILTDMMFRSTFPEQEMAKEKKVVIEEIKRAEDNPQGFGARELMRILSGMHPERASRLGTEASVSSITRDDLLRFHRQYYRPSNIVLVVTGHIDHEALVGYLESLAIPAVTGGPEPIELERLKPCPLDGRTFPIQRDIRQVQLHWGMYGPHDDSEDKYAGYIALHILGGGSASRLRKQIRGERGLAYEVGAGLSSRKCEGFVTGYVGTDPARNGEVRGIIIAELERLRTERVTEEELSRAKKSIAGRYLIAEDYQEAINGRLAWRHMYGEDADQHTFVDKIRAVEGADVQRFAEKYLDTSKMLFVEVSRDVVAKLEQDGEAEERTA
jgi:predicted Zn-dependent peptidase